MRLFLSNRLALTLLLVLPWATPQPGHAQAPGPAASAGPGRIICEAPAMCRLGIGDPAQIAYEINIEALPAADKDRLGKQCAPTSKTPCVATVTGTEMDDPLKVKAAKIVWYN